MSPVAYEIANTPHVLNAAPSPHRDSRPRTVGRRAGGRNTSRSGTGDRSSSALIFSNDGVSEAFSRTITPKTTSTMLIKNAIRQPYDSKAAPGSAICRNANTPVPKRQSERQPDLGHAAGEAASVRRAVLDGQQYGAGPLAAERESLRNPKQQQQHRGEHADLRGGGQQPHQSRGAAHQKHRQCQGLLTADAISDVAEYEPADGPDDEPDGERREGQQRPHERTLVREERVVEDEACSGGVEEEVVPLDGGADEAGQQGGANRRIESTSVLSGFASDCLDFARRQFGG